MGRLYHTIIKIIKTIDQPSVINRATTQRKDLQVQRLQLTKFRPNRHRQGFPLNPSAAMKESAMQVNCASKYQRSVVNCDFLLSECKEYAKLIRKKVVVASLSLDSSAQDVTVTQCDAVTGLVVGGVNAEPNEFPHMAAIGYPDFNGDISFKCGGSLISDRFVLTAAHCSKADRTSPTIIRLGDLNLKLKDKGLPEIDITIENFISHERYNKDSRENDIALIKMRQSAPFSKSIRPACVHQTENIEKSRAAATGWGIHILVNFI